MQSVSSRIWTRVAVFISYDDNNYTTGTYYTVYFKLWVSLYYMQYFGYPKIELTMNSL